MHSKQNLILVKNTAETNTYGSRKVPPPRRDVVTLRINLRLEILLSERSTRWKEALGECDRVEAFDIDNFVGFYLINNGAFHLKRLSVRGESYGFTSPVILGRDRRTGIGCTHGGCAKVAS